MGKQIVINVIAKNVLVVYKNFMEFLTKVIQKYNVLIVINKLEKVSSVTM